MEHRPCDCGAVRGPGAVHHPGALVAGHGPFAWGRDVAEAEHNAAVLEFVARLAAETLRIRPDASAVPDELLDKHFFRKHGPSAYYGQTKESNKFITEPMRSDRI